MCIFSKPVLSVTSTNIFGRLLDNGAQYLAYQMKYSSKELNAMILPLPVTTPADEKSLEFISLKEYDSFFNDLNNGFPVEAPLFDGIDSALPSRGMAKQKKKLKVVEVGEFVASFVPSLDDFDRLDDQFVVPRETWALIPAYADYGFAVFQLKSLEGKPHPMAFKFKSRLENRVFFPTVHIHDGEVHEEEDFDHTLYLQSASFDSVAGDYQDRDVVVPATGFARSKWNAGGFCDAEKSQGLVIADRLVHRKVMKGNLANTDIVANLDEDTLKRAKTISQLKVPAAVASGTIGLAGLGWFFHRRNKVRNKGSQK